MPERYTVGVKSGKPKFEMREEEIPQSLLSPVFKPDKAAEGYELVCRMGDPDLLQCIVWRRGIPHGGVFVLLDKSGVLYGAVAESALAFSVGLGYFGELTANARYGVDVFENLHELDD